MHLKFCLVLDRHNLAILGDDLVEPRFRVVSFCSEPDEGWSVFSFEVISGIQMG